MIHQQIKELFFSSVEHIVSDISQYAAIPIPISREAKKSLPRNLFPFSFHKAHLPPGIVLVISKLSLSLIPIT